MHDIRSDTIYCDLPVGKGGRYLRRYPEDPLLL
jgi:hypothetical protein